MVMMIMIKVKKKKKMMMTILKGKSSPRQNEKTFGTLPLTGLLQREKDWQICKIAENQIQILEKNTWSWSDHRLLEKRQKLRLHKMVGYNERKTTAIAKKGHICNDDEEDVDLES